MKNDFPDLALSFERMKLMDELDATVNANTILGLAIKKAFNDKEPGSEIVKLIRDSYNDNPNGLNNTIPAKLLMKLKKAFNFTEGNDNLKSVNIFNGLPSIDRDIID